MLFEHVLLSNRQLICWVQARTTAKSLVFRCSSTLMINMPIKKFQVWMRCTSVFLFFLFSNGCGLKQPLLEADTAAKHFIDQVRQGHSGKAYQATSTAYQQAVSRHQFHNFSNDWLKLQGTIKDIQRKGFKIYSGTDGRRVLLLYYATGSRQDMWLQMVMVPENGTWRILVCSFSKQPIDINL